MDLNDINEVCLEEGIDIIELALSNEDVLLALLMEGITLAVIGITNKRLGLNEV